MTSRCRAVLAALLVLLVACGESSALSWRDLSLTMPDGWRVAENRDTVLTITNRADVPDPDPTVTTLGQASTSVTPNDVLVQFLVVNSTTPAAWRQLVAAGGGVLEEDEPVEFDGAVGTRLTWAWTTNGIPTREMVIVVPSRNLEILFQPVARAGTENAPSVFVEHRDEFDAVIASLAFGAPVG